MPRSRTRSLLFNSLLYKSKGKAILNKSQHDKTYSLGPDLLLFSRALLDQTDLTRAAAPFLQELAVVPGTLAFLALIRSPPIRN